MNIVNPVVGQKDVNEITRDITSTIKGTEKILDLKEVEMGERFQGVCWASKIMCVANSYRKDSYNWLYTLYDKEGRQFTAWLYDQDSKIESKETPVNIEGTCFSHDGKTRKYKIFKVLQSALPIPRTTFLKEISNIETHKEKFIENYHSLTDQGLKMMCHQMLESGYTQKLMTETYKPHLGTRLGMSLIVTNLMFDAFNALSQASKEIDWNALKAASIVMHYHTTEIINGEVVEQYLPIDEVVYDNIMKSACSTSVKKVMLNILMDSKQSYQTLEREIYFNTLKSVEAVVKSLDAL